VISDRVAGESFLLSVFENMGVKEQGNPDFHAYRVESFDIASARALRERTKEKPFGEKKIFLVSAERFTPEAQNALLKTLEEPGENMHFFVLIHEQDLLLPTLLSRMHIVHPKAENLPPSPEPEEFLKLSPRDRLNFSKDFVDSEKSLPAFLDSLLRYLRDKKTDTKILNKVFTLRRFADDPSKMPRLILEHLSLVLD